MNPTKAMNIILNPYVTEKTFDIMETQNKLVFIVSDDANKNLIKHAIQTLYAVNVESVNLTRTIKGKKAYVKLSPDSSAADLASKLGIV